MSIKYVSNRIEITAGAYLIWHTFFTMCLIQTLKVLFKTTESINLNDWYDKNDSLTGKMLLKLTWRDPLERRCTVASQSHKTALAVVKESNAATLAGLGGQNTVEFSKESFISADTDPLKYAGIGPDTDP